MKKNIFLQIAKRKNTNKKNEAQMILLAGITISILIVMLAAVAANLSTYETSLSFEMNINPLEEYLNAREVFIDVFKETCNCEGLTGDDLTNATTTAFNHTTKTLANIQIEYGNYFTAELTEIVAGDYDPDPAGAPIYKEVDVHITLIIKDATIEEDIRIPVLIST